MKKSITLFVLLLALLVSNAQDVFVDAYSSNIFGRSLIGTPQGNLLVAGVRPVNNLQPSTATNFSDFGIMQMDTDGSPLMARVYHYQAHDEWLYAQNAVGGFVLGGESRPGHNSRENSAVVISRTDYRGNISWAKAFYAVNKQGILLTGISTNRKQETVFACLTRQARNSSSPRTVLGHLVKLDSAGNMTWQRTYILGDQFPFSATMRGSVHFTAHGGIAAGWQVSLPAASTAATPRQKGIAFQSFDPAGNLRWTRAFRANALLGMTYTPQDSGVAVYALDSLNRSGMIKLGKGGALTYAFLDDLPNNSNVNAVPRGANLKSEDGRVPYLFADQLTMSHGLRSLSPTTPVPPRPFAFPAIANKPHARFFDFVTHKRAAFITGEVYSPQHQKSFPVLFKSSFAGDVDNCFTQSAKTQIRQKFPLRRLRLNLASPPLTVLIINDSMLRLRNAAIPVADSLACVGNGDVWPGDANSDGYAEVKDIMTVGLSWGNQGPARPNASPRWIGQPARNWRGQFINGANHKHADCDGNGRVGVVDLAVILANYGRRHNKTATNGQQGDAPIFLQEPTAIVLPGKTVDIPVFLGDASAQGALHGLSFAVNYDPAWVGEDLRFIVQDSWLGDAENELISIQKNFPADGVMEIGISRTQRADASGHGQIGVLRFTPKTQLPTSVALFFEINETEGINAAEEKIDLFGHTDLLQIEISKPLEIVLQGVPQAPQLIADVTLHPNPTRDQLNIGTLDKPMQKIEILNGYGQLVLTKQPEQAQATLSLSHLPEGLYFVRIYTADGIVVKRIVKE